MVRKGLAKGWRKIGEVAKWRRVGKGSTLQLSDSRNARLEERVTSGEGLAKEAPSQLSDSRNARLEERVCDSMRAVKGA